MIEGGRIAGNHTEPHAKEDALNPGGALVRLCCGRGVGKGNEVALTCRGIHERLRLAFGIDGAPRWLVVDGEWFCLYYVWLLCVTRVFEVLVATVAVATGAIRCLHEQPALCEHGERPSA